MLRSDAVLLNKVLYLLAMAMQQVGIRTAFLVTPSCASVPKPCEMLRSLASLQLLDT
jgi:hypothetical protein